MSDTIPYSECRESSKPELPNYKSYVYYSYVLLHLIKRISRTHEHRLKNDYSDLVSSVKYLGRRFKDEADQRVIEEIQNLDAVVQRLKNLSIDFAQDLTTLITYGRRSISDIVGRSVNDLRLDQAAKGDNIEFDMSEIPGDVFVFCSDIAREHIYNVLNNSYEQIRLVRSSKTLCQFIGRIKVRVTVEPILDNRGTERTYNLAVVTIEDNAGGVKPDYELRIFDIGFTTKDESGGTGFGLPAAQDYMRSLGGGFEFKNLFPDGAIVTFKFPIYTPVLHDAMIQKLNIEDSS